MAARIAQSLSIVFAVVAAGCASAPSRYYTLASTATPDGAPAATYAVIVGPVSVPAAVDRPEFVVEVAPNRVELDEFNQWAAPLNDGIGRAVAGNLAVLLGTPDVAVAPLANFNPAYRVTIAVQRFDSMPGKGVLLDAAWVVQQTADGKSYPGRTLARENLAGDGFDAIAAAHSRALATLSADIAAAIRSAQSSAR